MRTSTADSRSTRPPDEVEALRPVVSRLSALRRRPGTPRAPAAARPTPRRRSVTASPARLPARPTPTRFAVAGALAAPLLGAASGSEPWSTTIRAGWIRRSELDRADGAALRRRRERELTVAEDDAVAPTSASADWPRQRRLLRGLAPGDRGLVSLGSFRVGAEADARSSLWIRIENRQHATARSTSRSSPTRQQSLALQRLGPARARRQLIGRPRRGFRLSRRAARVPSTRRTAKRREAPARRDLSPADHRPA